MFRVDPPPIIRSITLYLQHLVFVKPLLLPAAIVVVLRVSTLHVSVGSPTHHQEHNTVFTTSGICHTVTATCRYRDSVESFNSTCFGWIPTHHQERNTVFTTSGICQTVTATCRYRGSVESFNSTCFGWIPHPSSGA